MVPPTAATTFLAAIDHFGTGLRKGYFQSIACIASRSRGRVSRWMILPATINSPFLTTDEMMMPMTD